MHQSDNDGFNSIRNKANFSKLSGQRVVLSLLFEGVSSTWRVQAQLPACLPDCISKFLSLLIEYIILFKELSTGKF